MTRASSRGPRRRAEAVGEARAGSYLIRAGFSARSRRAHPQNSRMRRSADASERLICNDHPSSCALAPQLRCARGSSCAGLPGRGCQLCSFIGLRCCYWRLPPGSGVVLAICGYAGQLIDFTWHVTRIVQAPTLASLCPHCPPPPRVACEPERHRDLPRSHRLRAEAGAPLRCVLL